MALEIIIHRQGMENIAPNVWKLNVDSNVYLLKLREWVVIDTGPCSAKEEVRNAIRSLAPLNKVAKVVFTHLHFDHIGNFDLFPKADFFASSGEIQALGQNKMFTILDASSAREFSPKLKPLKDMLGLKVIATPGHSPGSVCLWYGKEEILFSGDTLFAHGYGRVDFPFSDAEAMEKSLALVRKMPYKILAAGHDY
ncbi:MBL fold metallo-hydrolase [Candidatus Woesearchaeota archaeon]|nr:MBL fold metallo-hydrolase [Candidatus Woesearchaeota archaeon]